MTFIMNIPSNPGLLNDKKEIFYIFQFLFLGNGFKCYHGAHDPILKEKGKRNVVKTPEDVFGNLWSKDQNQNPDMIGHAR